MSKKIVIIPTIFSSSYSTPSVHTGDPFIYNLLNGQDSIPSFSNNSSSLITGNSSLFTTSTFNSWQTQLGYLGAAKARIALLLRMIIRELWNLGGWGDC